MNYVQGAFLKFKIEIVSKNHKKTQQNQVCAKLNTACEFI